MGGGLSSSAFDTPFVDAAVGDTLASFSSDSVVTDSGYQVYDDDDWLITYGGNNMSIGTSSKRRDGATLANYPQYVVDPITDTSTAVAVANKNAISNVGNINISWNGGINNSRGTMYVLNSEAADGGFSVVATETISSSETYEIALESNLSGYFAVVWVDSGTSGNYRFDNVIIDFVEGSQSYNVTNIEITGTPTQTVYSEFDEFNPEGLTITAHYDNSTTADVTGEVTWTPSPLTLGTEAVVAHYTFNGLEVTATYSGITVNAREVRSIAVTTLPSVTEYAIGESIDYTGIVVTATFTDETTVDVTSLCTFNPEEGTVLETAGTQMVTVTYGSVSTTFNVEVSSTIEGTYTLVSPAYGSIPEGAMIVATGGGATASWAIPNYITATWEQNGGSNPINLGYPQMRFYQRHRITFTPTSPSVILKQIVFTAANSSYASRLNSEVTWSSGVNHSVSGDVVTATTATSMPIVLTMPSSGAQIQVDTIEITYTVSTESFGTLDHIELNTNDVKTEYHALDAFTTEGLIVTAYDTAGVTKVVDNYTTSIEEGHIFDSYGPQTVVVTYSENDVTVEASYEINVSASPAYSYTLRETDYEAGAIPPAGLTSSLGGLNWSIYSDASISAFDKNRGLHIGISNSQASYLDFRSELFLGTEAGSLVTRVEVVLAGNSGTEGIVSLSVGGTEFTSTDTTLEGSSLQTFVFTGTPSLGHINLHIDKAETGDGVFYINSINVYADINAEAGAAVRAARTIESVDVCDTSAENITNLQNAADAYNSLGENSYIDSIMIDDYQNPGNAKRSFNLLNVGEKIAAINNVLAGENVGNAGIVNGNNSSNDTILIVACALLGVAALGGAFFYMKKRKEVR